MLTQHVFTKLNHQEAQPLTEPVLCLHQYKSVFEPRFLLTLPIFKGQTVLSSLCCKLSGFFSSTKTKLIQNYKTLNMLGATATKNWHNSMKQFFSFKSATPTSTKTTCISLIRRELFGQYKQRNIPANCHPGHKVKQNIKILLPFWLWSDDGTTLPPSSDSLDQWHLSCWN